MHDAKVCACGEQDEFDSHARQYIFSRMYVCCRVKSVIPALHQALPIYPSKQAILKSDRTSRLGPIPDINSTSPLATFFVTEGQHAAENRIALGR